MTRLERLRAFLKWVDEINRLNTVLEAAEQAHDTELLAHSLNDLDSVVRALEGSSCRQWTSGGAGGAVGGVFCYVLAVLAAARSCCPFASHFYWLPRSSCSISAYSLMFSADLIQHSDLCVWLYSMRSCTQARCSRRPREALGSGNTG
jgi:hypothetical protein